MFYIFNKTTQDKGYILKIYKIGCASDYPNARCNGEDVIIVDENDCDMEFCFAKAYVALKEWLLEFNRGY